MTERKYSLAELDRMRKALYWKHAERDVTFRTMASDRVEQNRIRAYCAGLVEDELRTCLMAGIDPDELDPVLATEGAPDV